MRKILLTSVASTALLTSVAAQAADLPAAYKAPPPAPIFSWTGVYVGVTAGGGWGHSDWSDPTAVFGNGFNRAAGPTNVDGLLYGGQIGANYQVGRWVVGVEANANWADIEGNNKCLIVGGGTSFTCNTKIDSVGTVTARLGQAYGNVLLYGNAGFGWAHEKYNMIDPAGNTPPVPPVLNNFNAAETRWGWVLGTGVEIAMRAGWSMKFEYNYLGLGNRTNTFADQFGNRPPISIHQHLNLVKFGVNYRWGAGDPPVAVAAAGGGLYKAPVLLPTSDWAMEVGTRFWMSSGRMQKDLYDPGFPSVLNSRLIYAGLTGYSNEAFGRWDHKSGIFVKGFFGMGDITKGTLNDEDFPPFTVPYSNTVSDIKNSKMRYAAADVGYNFLNWADGKVGAFVGYRYFYERVNGYGCLQIATAAGCINPAVFAAQPTSLLTLTEGETWRGAAIGLNSQVMLWPSVKLEVDAAYLPYVNRAGWDNHWNRPDINPQIENGNGWGAQLEAILSYMVTDKFSVGVGGRYWYFTTNSANTQFPGVASPSPMKFYAERYGGFLQASYKFDERDLPFAVK